MAAILTKPPEHAAFDPDAIAAISCAFDETCIALHVFAGDERGRQAIAMRIIDLATQGMVDSEALRDRVIREARSAA